MHQRQNNLYHGSLSLLTDLYQLTMAYGYWKAGMAEHDSVFNLFFRRHPFGGHYTIASGLESVVNYIQDFALDDSDAAYLESLTGSDGSPLFEPAFIEYLHGMRFSGDIDAIYEGTIVHPFEPLIRLQGPLLQCQILETPLLNIMNFQTLIATKSARICQATQGEPVLEFGLRRAQGVDGALSASRAAYVGGCSATSNVLAGKLYDIPVKGTHAHSWVMCFDSELESFQTYADAMPNNCVFLVDTYDTLDGVRNAIEVGRTLRAKGYEMIGVRLDSGDLAQLSIDARKLLDEAGFPKAAIVASNDLDEHVIAKLKSKGATIGVWGVGTRLVTAYDQPALGGVYKLAAIREPGKAWQYRIKLSEQPIKVSNPGRLQVRRFYNNGQPSADMIYDADSPPSENPVLVDCLDPKQRQSISANQPYEDLLQPIFRNGSLVMSHQPLHQLRERTLDQLATHDNKPFTSGLYEPLHELKMMLMNKARGAGQ